MLVRDPSVNRVFLGPRDLIQQLPLINVAGSIPIIVPQSTATPSPIDTPVSTPSPISDEDNIASSSTKAAKIPRPPNAFIIFRKAHHADVVAQNPGVHNNDICKFLFMLSAVSILTSTSCDHWPDVE
jgi:hypothetical protein